MVTTLGAVAAPPSASDLIPTPKPSAQGSFEQQLLAALKGYLHQSGDDSGHLQIDVRREPGQNSGKRQFLVTVTTLPDVAPKTGQQAGSGAAAPPSPALAPAHTAQPAAPDTTPRRSADVYWERQPKEVQALRNIPDEASRLALGQELAAKGYSIDVPIMVWGWDPLTTMIVRQNQGFTWVPAGHMAPLQVTPGCNFPGLVSYDPNNPPPGAIKVTTDFAKGTHDDWPWLKDWSPAGGAA